MKRSLDTSFVQDTRARVPFAVIGVILLVSSVMIVGYLETRPEPEEDVDRALAVDRTNAATQSVVSDAVIDATDRAAEAPVTSPAEDGPFEGVLGDPGDSEDAVFQRYTSLLVYMEVQERLEQAGQSLGQDTETEVSLPPVEDADDAEAAIDRVILEPGYDIAGLDTGMLRVTIRDVETVVREDGEAVAPPRTEDVTVTVAVPLFELHHTTGEYEDALETDFWEGGAYEGFGQYFAARIYPIAYARIYANYMTTSPRGGTNHFENIVPNNQTEVFANHAIFSLQDDTFGTRDPYASRTMRGAFACWVAREGETLMDGSYDGDVDADDVCEGLEYIYGDASGSLPEAPTLTELAQDEIDNSEAMDREQELEWNLFGDLAYHDVGGINMPDDYEPSGDFRTDEYEGSDEDGTDFSHPQDIDGIPDDFTDDVEELVTEVYTVHLNHDHTEPSSYSPPYPDEPSAVDGPEWEEEADPLDIDPEDVTVEPLTEWDDDSGQERTAYEVRISVRNHYTRDVTWTNTTSGREIERDAADTHTFSTVVTVDAEHSPSVDLDGHSQELEHTYTSGGSTGPGTVANFDRVQDRTFQDVFGVSDATQLRTNIEPLNVEDEGDFMAEIGDYESAGDPIILESSEVSSEFDDVEEWVRDSVRSDIRSDVRSEEPYVVSYNEYITGDPFEDMRDDLDDRREELIYDGSRVDPLENAPELASAHLRSEYVDRMDGYLQDVGDFHGEQQETLEGSVEDAIGEDANNVLGDSLEFAQDAMNGGIDANGGSLQSPDIVDEINYEVRGSPTYLSLDVVTRETVPAVRPAGTPSTEVEDTNHVPMTARYDNHIPYPGLPLLPLPNTWLVSVSTWDIDVRGEYARFEVTANTGDPSTPSSTTYVREDADVPITIGGIEGTIGHVDPIDFESTTFVAGVVPPGRAGVGDTTDYSLCPETWDNAGPDFEIPDDQSGSCHSNVDRMP